jgi:hypothetical protein
MGKSVENRAQAPPGKAVKTDGEKMTDVFAI